MRFILNFCNIDKFPEYVHSRCGANTSPHCRASLNVDIFSNYTLLKYKFVCCTYSFISKTYYHAPACLSLSALAF